MITQLEAQQACEQAARLVWRRQEHDPQPFDVALARLFEMAAGWLRDGTLAREGTLLGLVVDMAVALVRLQRKAMLR